MNNNYLLPSIFCLFSFFATTEAQTIDRGPYLQLVTTSSIYIHWRTDSQTDSKVWYGDAPNNLTSILNVPGNRTDHEINITGLSPNTTYYYAVGDSNGELAGNDDNHFFKTAPNTNTNETIRAWVLGNAGNNHSLQRDVRDGFNSFIGNSHIDLMLLLGDNAYDDGTDSEYQVSWFQNMYEDRLIQSVMYSSFGNHDGGASDSDEESGPYYDIFNFPANAQAGGIASGTEAYYSFDYGNIHFISINSFDIDRSVGAPMYNWLVDDLNNTNQEWIVAFFHYPPYTGNDNNSSDTHPKETDMRENFLPVLESAGVDLVLSSHHHSYQRSYFINGHYDVSGTWDENTMGLDIGDGRPNGDGEYSRAIDGPGTVYMVSGSAGSVGSNPAGYPAMFTSAQELGSVYLEVTGQIMDVKFIDDGGNIDDYFTISKGGSAPSVDITNPADNDFYSFPETVSIAADASDDGSVTQVEFFIDNVSIGSDNNSPYSIAWTMPGTGSFEIKAVATDNDDYTSSSIVNIQVGDGSTCVKISNDNDDVEEDDSGGMSMTSSDLELIAESTDQIIGLRFPNINIPQGAAITSAFIQFTCDEIDNVSPCNLEIFAEDSDNANAFSSGDFNVSNRPKTSTSVTWSPADWTGVGDVGLAQKTVDISSVIQEVVDRPNFSLNSAVVIIIEGVGKRVAESYNGSTSGAPEICVEYSLGGPLPVSLLAFNARPLDKKIVLDWSTASEMNNEYFILERSTDGTRFQELARLPGNGTTSEISNYHYIDQNPDVGINYYRLKQTDYNGEFGYSKIVNATIDDKNSFRLYPSMVQDIIIIESNVDGTNPLIVTVHDLTGKVFKSFELSSSNLRSTLSLSGLTSGAYFVSIHDGLHIENFKIIKL